MKSQTRPRETFGVRINPKIKKEFLDAVKEKKLNSCHIIEALMIAWVEGTKKRPRGLGLAVGSTLTINQKFENVVARSRREIKGSKLFKPEDNCYKNTMWSYRKPEKGELVSILGHVSECECNVCKPFVARFLHNKRESKLW